MINSIQKKYFGRGDYINLVGMDFEFYKYSVVGIALKQLPDMKYFQLRCEADQPILIVFF